MAKELDKKKEPKKVKDPKKDILNGIIENELDDDLKELGAQNYTHALLVQLIRDTRKAK